MFQSWLWSLTNLGQPQRTQWDLWNVQVRSEVELNIAARDTDCCFLFGLWVSKSLHFAILQYPGYFCQEQRACFGSAVAQVVDESNIGVVKSTGKGLCLTIQIKLPWKVSSVLFACFTLIVQACFTLIVQARFTLTVQALLWATVNIVCTFTVDNCCSLTLEVVLVLHVSAGCNILSHSTNRRLFHSSL